MICIIIADYFFRQSILNNKKISTFSCFVFYSHPFLSNTKTPPMKNQRALLPVFAGCLLLSILFLQTRCSNEVADKPLTQEQMIARGRYLVTVASCNDCHTPKIFTPTGPLTDTTRLMSGHPADSPMPKMDTNALHPGYWALASPDLTAWVGPWGISYTANLTADSTTGIGAWTDEMFIGTLRTGHHMGLPGGRALLPPMPWPFIGQMTDEDLKSVFAYLRSLPVVKNAVPPPVAPPDVLKM